MGFSKDHGHGVIVTPKLSLVGGLKILDLLAIQHLQTGNLQTPSFNQLTCPANNIIK